MNEIILPPTGELYRLYRGDAVSRLKCLPNECIDAFVTDPPYGIELRIGTKKLDRDRSIRGDGRLQARMLWSRWLPEMHRVAKPDTLHVVFGTWKSPWMHELLAKHFRVVGCIAWDKKITGLGFYLRPRWEMLYVVAKGKPPRRGVAPADVWTQARVLNPQHPCEKPIDLLRRAVCLVSDPGQIIADSFAGICSSGVAALKEGRRFFGTEIDQRFVKLGQKRLTGVASNDDAKC